ncbi:hypothetical protein AZF01_21020 [Martelella sp. AD-3]|nr:hypothetical protein AZF01_21020 [Martelella sp. AD-3]
MVAGIFANQDFMARARLPLGEIDTNPTGRGLNCGTPHLADACGVLIFDRIDGDWKLTRAEGLRTQRYGSAGPSAGSDA